MSLDDDMTMVYVCDERGTDNMIANKFNDKRESVKAIFFDFGGTLYELDEAVTQIWEDALSECGVEFDIMRFFNVLREARASLDRHTARKVHLGQDPTMPFAYWVSYHASMLRNMGVREGSSLIDLSTRITKSVNGIQKKFRINRDTKKTLVILRQRYKIGLISNTSSNLRTYLSEDDIFQHFDVIGLSYEMALWKPDSRIFEKCCLAIGQLPENSIYVGDSLICDVEGALNAGMIPILVHDQKKCPQTSGREPISVRNVSEILKILQLSE